MQKMEEVLVWLRGKNWEFWTAAAIVAAVSLIVLLSVVKGIYGKIKRRKAVKKMRQREREFALPDRENEFVKERLQTRLQGNEEEKKEYRFSECVPSFDYARTLLCRLKAAPLSAAERLSADGISRDITHFAFQEKLTSEEVRKLNERLSEMIKLSAKYCK